MSAKGPKPPSKTAAPKRKAAAPPVPIRNDAVADKLRGFAEQGTSKPDAALILDLDSPDIIDQVYARDWARGLAMGEARLQQALFEQSVGRPARLDPETKHVLRSELKPNASTAAALQKQRLQTRRAIDFSKVHPELRPAGVVLPPPPTKPKKGRPRFSGKFTKALGEEICRRLSEGEFLSTICKDEHIPPRWTVYDWAADPVTYPDFSQQFAQAREDQIEAWRREAMEIAENPGVHLVEVWRSTPDGDIMEIRREQNAQGAKLRVETRLKLVAMAEDGRRRAEFYAHQREMRLMAAELNDEYGGVMDSVLDDMDDQGQPRETVVRIVGGTPKPPAAPTEGKG